MATRSVHIGQHIRCSAQRAYAFASDPANLPMWAAGLGGSIVSEDGQWRVPTPEGDAVVEFVPANEHGVLDHTVVLPDGTCVYNPMRVLPDGEGCEVVFTLRRRPGMTDHDVERDAAAVTADLRTLQQTLERNRTPGGAGTPQPGAVPLRFVLVADIPSGAEGAFQRYESLVLPLLARHGGHLERRLRTDDALHEVHIVSFESQDGCASYLADEERQSHRAVLGGAVVEQRLLQVHDV